MLIVPLKQCSQCREWRPKTLEFWYRRVGRPDNLYGTCKICHSLKGKDHYKENAEQVKAASKAYYEAHREEANAKNLARAASNREKDNARRYRWRRENYAHYRERWRSYEQNRRAREANAEGTYTDADFQIMLEVYEGCCHWCGEKIEGSPHADHVIPLSRGGRNDMSNIVPACQFCNLSKGSKLPEEWKALTI